MRKTDKEKRTESKTVKFTPGEWEKLKQAEPLIWPLGPPPGDSRLIFTLALYGADRILHDKAGRKRKPGLC